jgi:hypothetical protein
LSHIWKYTRFAVDSLPKFSFLNIYPSNKKDLGMKSIHLKNIVALIALCSLSSATRCAELLKGDAAAAPQETFSFPVQVHVGGSTGQGFFVGALPGTTPKEFAVSGILRDQRVFIPLAQQKVTLNNRAAENPLYDKGVLFLSMFETLSVMGNAVIERPVVVSEVDQTRVFVLDNITNLANIIMYQTDQLRDAQGMVTSGIVGMTAGSLELHNSVAFAAVKSSAGGNFGDLGSGIALIGPSEKKEKETVDGKEVERSQRSFNQIDAGTGFINAEMVRAVAFDRTSASIKIGSDVAQLDVNDMFWSKELQRLYIALGVTAGNNIGDGARSIAVGRLVFLQELDENGNHITRAGLALEKIVDDLVFMQGAQNEIIGALAPNAQITARKVRVLNTSTRLHYLVVLGGNVGVPDQTQQTVYAMPLVNNFNNSAQHGTLASKDAVPENIFFDPPSNSLIGRSLKQPATTHADLLLANDMTAQVGGGPVPAGNVTDMFVQSDAVFVAVGDPDINQKAGLFVSTALFDELGRIKGWTAWQRVAGTTEQTFGAVYDPERGSFSYLVGPTMNMLQTIKRTVWTSSIGDDPSPLQDLVRLLGQEFPGGRGGIQSLTDFSVTTQGLGGNVSWMVVTGLKKIALVETGRTIMGAFCPNAGDFSADLVQETAGAISANLPQPGTDPKVVIMSGGSLDTIGAITCAEIVAANSNYLAVGGVNGLAILTDNAGAGWGVIDNAFMGLVQGMSFKTIGNYRFVRKLISSQGYLYVLTDTQLDRIDVNASNFATGTVVSVRLASRDSLVGNQGSFLDALISEKLALLATNSGLFRSGNNVNIADVALATEQDVAWTLVNLPQALLPISYLLPISKTGHLQDISQDLGGVIYVISGDIGNNRARLSRISISDSGGMHVVDDMTVRALDDLFIRNSPSYFINLSGFRNIVSTDGSIRFITVDRNLNESPSFLVLPPSIATGTPLAAVTAKPLPIGFAGASDIVQLLRLSASGSWIAAGDFGVIVNE